jgi:hypothetical protein
MMPPSCTLFVLVTFVCRQSTNPYTTAICYTPTKERVQACREKPSQAELDRLSVQQVVAESKRARLS